MAETKAVYRKPKKKIHLFDVLNYIIFIIIGLLVLVPIWKVVSDSFNSVGVYQFKLWPDGDHFTLDGYRTILETEKLYRPFKIGERRVGKECRSRWSPYH